MSYVKVVLSDHAKKRCRQQGLSEGVMRMLTSRLPQPKGVFRWKTLEGVEIVYTQRGSTRIIVTLIGTEKQFARWRYHQMKIYKRLNRKVCER